MCGLNSGPVTQKYAKLGQKGRGLPHLTYFLMWRPPLYLRNGYSYRDFKFSAQIDRRVSNQKHAKVGQEGRDVRGRDVRHVTYFYNFRIPSISLEWVKLETSNLACSLNANNVNQKYANVGQQVRGLRHVTYFFIMLGPPLYLWNG